MPFARRDVNGQILSTDALPESGSAVANSWRSQLPPRPLGALGDLDGLRADYVWTMDSNTLLAPIGSRERQQYMHHS